MSNSNSKHWFTTSFLWRKVPESDARSVCPTMSYLNPTILRCPESSLLLGSCQSDVNTSHYCVCSTLVLVTKERTNPVTTHVLPESNNAPVVYSEGTFGSHRSHPTVCSLSSTPLVCRHSTPSSFISTDIRSLVFGRAFSITPLPWNNRHYSLQTPFSVQLFNLPSRLIFSSVTTE